MCTLIDDACTTMALKHDGKKIDAETVHAVYMAYYRVDTKCVDRLIN